VIATGLMTKIGLPGHEWQTYWSNVLAHTIVAFAGYLVCGGWRLFRFRYQAAPGAAEEPKLERTHWITLAVIFTLIASVLFFKINVGMGAFACALLLPLLGAADHVEAIKRMPWSVIVLVTGVTVLVSILEKTQGIQLFADLLARFATAGTVTAVVAFVAGLVSVYASTSGVILPTFLPIVPGLAAKFPGASALAIATAVNVGGHLVDVSPLSTIGALCIAAAPASVDSTKLFHHMLVWGLSMTIAGTVLCLTLFGH
jgi:Na+/H+ antiporter NhaD/arsenite permease-like protein